VSELRVASHPSNFSSQYRSETRELTSL
jgi:hypothetical protein